MGSSLRSDTPHSHSFGDRLDRLLSRHTEDRLVRIVFVPDDGKADSRLRTVGRLEKKRGSIFDIERRLKKKIGGLQDEAGLDGTPIAAATSSSARSAGSSTLGESPLASRNWRSTSWRCSSWP